jgi:hypothetical protein
MRVWVAARHSIFRRRTRRRSSVFRAAPGPCTGGGRPASRARTRPRVPRRRCRTRRRPGRHRRPARAQPGRRPPRREPSPTRRRWLPPARAGGVRLRADLVPVAVAQVLQGQGPGHMGPVAIDRDALRLKLCGECDPSLPLGAGGAEAGDEVPELNRAVLRRLDQRSQNSLLCSFILLELLSCSVSTCRELPFCPVARFRTALRVPGCAGPYRGIRANMEQTSICTWSRPLCRGCRRHGRDRR